MKKTSEELRPEYDFNKLKIAARGPGRLDGTVRLDPDVLARFPTSKDVNDALRSLMQSGKRKPA
ncbi:MAG: hypothetical protein WAO58_05815 [Fimbriimonadaceae bacterium]